MGDTQMSSQRRAFFGCRACKTPLYSYAAKFNSGCGWPAFDKFYYFKNKEGKYCPTVDQTRDDSLGFMRIEITCAACGGHLGHVFEKEGFKGKQARSDERHCVNSTAVKYFKQD